MGNLYSSEIKKKISEHKDVLECLERKKKSSKKSIKKKSFRTTNQTQLLRGGGISENSIVIMLVFIFSNLFGIDINIALESYLIKENYIRIKSASLINFNDNTLSGGYYNLENQVILVPFP